MPDLEKVLIRKCGHWTQQEHPEQVNAAHDRLAEAALHRAAALSAKRGARHDTGSHLHHRQQWHPDLLAAADRGAGLEGHDAGGPFHRHPAGAGPDLYLADRERLPGGAGRRELLFASGVMAFFTSPALATAGWVHYLVFDLFIGAWEVRNSRRRGVPHWFVIPCLIVTLMFGPAGLALLPAAADGAGQGRAPCSPRPEGILQAAQRLRIVWPRSWPSSPTHR